MNKIVEREIKYLIENLNKFINAPEKISKYGCEINVIQAKYILKLQQRIDKSIEYIKSNEWAKDYKLSSCRTHLLDILRGEDDK